MEKESTPEVQVVDEEDTEGMATDDIRNSEEEQSVRKKNENVYIS